MSAAPIKGPWTYKDGVVWAPGAKIVALISKRLASGDDFTIEQADANGRAIAALPDLIQTLRDIGKLSQNSVVVNAAHAALKQA